MNEQNDKIKFVKEYTKYHNPVFEINRLICRDNQCNICELNNLYCGSTNLTELDISDITDAFPEYFI